MNNTYFKHFPCPTDRLLTPFRKDHLKIQAELVYNLRLNPKILLSTLDLDSVNISRKRPSVTLYPDIPDDVMKKIQTLNTLFDAYAIIRIKLFYLMRATPKGHKDSGVDTRKRTVTTLFNILIVFIKAMRLNRISSDMINQIMEIDPTKPDKIEKIFRWYGLIDLLETDPITEKESILIVSDKFLLDSVWKYVRKNTKRSSTEFGKKANSHTTSTEESNGIITIYSKNR